MTTKNLRTAMLAAAALFAVCGAAHANDLYRTTGAGTGVWSDLNCWEVDQGGGYKPAGHVPNATTDSVQIRHNLVLNMNATVNSLTVDATKQLDVGAGGTAYTLTIGGSSPSTSISGTVFLNGSGQTIQVATTVTFSGSGDIYGNDNASQIFVAVTGSSNVTLTNNVLIHGRVYIDRTGAGAGAANFVNNSGSIDSDAHVSLAAIQIGSTGSGLNVSDASGNKWNVSDPWATLRFEVPATSLAGSFHVSAGSLLINQNVKTSGCGSVASGASIVVAATPYFEIGSICGGGACMPVSPAQMQNNTWTNCP